jgi:flavin reductase (DIM6/NTAB) family NADH-FMN oxidoreductase RutF
VRAPSDPVGGAIFAAGRFGLNFLSAEHAELAEAFAAPTVDPEDRFRRAR